MKTFLLHVCCAPCSVSVIQELKEKFMLTVFFYNPNIYPEDEYLKRKEEVFKICKEWGIPIVDMDYETQVWSEAVKGLEQEFEGGIRCTACFKMRLEKTAQHAKKYNFNYFGSSLTFGRNKKAETINPIGASLEEKYGIIFYKEDWKKSGRQEKGRKIVEEKGIYRQDYCGCIFSLRNKK